jgi:hypothetical protein
MASNDMSNALKNPHTDVPFAQVGNDTIAALTKLAEIFKNKFQKVQAPGLNKSPADLSQPILTSHVRQQCQTRLQTIINTTSEGADALTKSFTQKFVTRRFLGHGIS